MSDDCLVRMENITVQFPGVLALNNVRFDVKRGEVHILLGENGAGKSTIMKVLAGVNTDYQGVIYYKNHEIKSLSVKEQIERGISMIFQETNLLKNLTVAENIFLGRQPTKSNGNVNWNLMNEQARKLLDAIGSNISEKAMVSSLSIGQMQVVEIAKALSYDADIIIMDEPTSALSQKEVEGLFKIIRELTSKGVAIVYISHRLEEIIQIGDRITVFRDGRYVETVPVDGITVDKLISMMVGRSLSEQYPKLHVEPGEKLLEVNNLVQKDSLNNISFYARSNEIVGFYGLMGAGRTELMRAVFGVDPFESGDIHIDGKPVNIRNCLDARKHGIAFLTEDRKNQGLILDFSIKDNIPLVNFDNIMNWFGINQIMNTANCQKLTDSVRVKTPSLNQKTKFLSGGNQQKVVIAKWLNTDSQIFIFDEPTRGIDVGAKSEIYKIMNSLKKEGKAVIMVSSELPETLGVCDRLYVMHDGTITGCFDDMSELTEDEVIKYATGTHK
ncbi:sugar ABC transporter ATP-binding protein [Paenibacillus alginolyticus]|uniref:sugar ABC transporter ATP-binding protein n=1 Tax=Paenibacillus alginolyticus TaxID=59839 RepID=UPI0004182892|nr:sugar ABC transporter ATP-binding protein [Paenibacillus alginolyticus]MCY9665811.1 sugar ABC transporter ATP-binding protein [Paenibacillus alginolyticus]